MKTTLEIQNLKCGGCGATIYNKLSGLENIKEFFINVDDSTITFDCISADNLHAVKEALFNMGYPILGEENKPVTRAKSYVSCAIGKITK